MDGLAMALHAVATTELLARSSWLCSWPRCFHTAVEKAVNFLGDADTVGAIAGQLAGAFYGVDAIDERARALRGLKKAV